MREKFNASCFDSPCCWVSCCPKKKKKKDFWSAAWKIQCTMMRFFHQSRVHIGSNHLYLVPAPFTNQPWDRSHTHTSLSHDDETAWRKLQSRWHLLCLYSRFLLSFSYNKSCTGIICTRFVESTDIRRLHLLEAIWGSFPICLVQKTPLDVNSRLRQSKSYSNIRNQRGPPGDPPLTHILTCTLQLKKEVGNPNKLFIISRCYSL